MKLSLADKVTLSTETLFQDVGGEAVLLDLASESYLGLDEVGTRIWRLLQKNGHLQAVFYALLAEYAVEPAQLEHDLIELVAQLREAGLVTVERGDVPAA
jgi:hypothetical protein